MGDLSGANLATAEWVDRNGNFWAGFWGGGAVFFDKNDFNNPIIFPCIQKDPNSSLDCYLQSIIESRDGRIWFGSAVYGLSVYDPKGGSWKNFKKNDNQHNGLQHNYVRNILEDKKGMLWLGTYGGGLYRFDPVTEQFKHYGRKDGLTDDLIEDLKEDQNGYIWIVTNDELSRFDPVNETFQNFGKEDGLPKTKFKNLTPPSQVSGQMYLSTHQGYVAFHPESVGFDSIPPATTIVKMKRYGSDVASGVPIEEKGISYRDEINLTYQDNIVTFELAAITFHKAAQTVIEYKLEGFQNDWIRLDDSRQISFTSLPSGSYSLLVRSANADGIWDKTPAMLHLHVSPPWWRT